MQIDHSQRRNSERLPLDIEAMILEENDPKQRAFLIVLNAINNSLLANTTMTRDLSEKLETHLQVYASHAASDEALLNKGRGIWSVGGWIFGIIQIIGLGIWNQARVDIKDITIASQYQHEEASKLMSRVSVLEAKK